MRNCLVRISADEEPIKCKFHCWSQTSNVIQPSLLVGGHNGGTVIFPVGIVEDEEGQVRTVYPNDIKFIGGENDE